MTATMFDIFATHRAPSRRSAGDGATAISAARAIALIIAMALSGASLAPTAVMAQDVGISSGTFLTPFPDKEVYQISIIGDGFADDMAGGLNELLVNDARVNIAPKIMSFPGIMTSSFDDKVADFEASLKSQSMNVAVVMIGYWDRVSLRSSSGQRVRTGSEEWMAEYQRRLSRMMKAVKANNVGVYWVGLPILAKSIANEQAQRMNDVIREQSYLNGFKYIDAYTAFADETSTYSPYGPDLEGKIRLLRLKDGIGFTTSGKSKLAHFVEQELKRDMIQARAGRTLPLLGAADEQAKINPDNANKAPSPLSPAGKAAATASAADATKRGAALTGTRDEEADNGKIELLVPGQGGRDEKVAVEIVRPAIPASVISLMARRQTGGQLGDMLIEQLPGGLTLMSSITSSGNKARGKIAPTQAPYFRLLVKGERLQPKPGRADDTSWTEGEKASGRQRTEPPDKG